CPQVSTTFLITKLIVHDVAVVSVVPSVAKVFPCDVVYITVIVKNKGNEAETFNVTTYYNEIVIDTKMVADLPPGAETTLMFAWSTCVPVGNYTISAVASIVPGETNIEDNTFVNGVVQVMARPPLPPIHDVAVLSVSPSKTIVYIGEVVNIYVVVKNQGNHTETFDLTAYADINATVIGDEIIVGTWIVRNLEPNEERSLVFRWNTRNMAEGNYTLSAEASVVLGEFNTENNRFVNGVVWVKLWVFPPVWEVPKELLVLLFLLAALIGACLVAAIIFAFLWRRRRKKKDGMDKQPARPEVEFKTIKTCSMCGKDFLGTYTFCPYCFTFHGKDYE
ncbi:MAG: CARDB domain-containing protein, partial [Candidatus Bathyarchaeota archaeon]|nr:CARDB domain-containing protein [Candidatus Bathyarchaeota archaeon]